MHAPSGPPGQIVLLNGVSSSGKTSIAEQLLIVLQRPWFHLPVDAINGMRAKHRTLALSPAELARRELLRGDREPGLAAAQQELVHAHGCYDLECDTTSTSPLDCALRIKDFLARPDPPAAFEELRARPAEGVMLPLSSETRTARPANRNKATKATQATNTTLCVKAAIQRSFRLISATSPLHLPFGRSYR